MSSEAGEGCGEGATPHDPISGLQTLLGYRFGSVDLLRRALTHRSYVNEHEPGGSFHNESLEFLGDAVLGFLVSSRVFSRFPNHNEGELSKIRAHLVSAVNLQNLAEKIHLGDYIRLSRGEEKTGGRKKRAIVVDAYEAIIGAIYVDGGIDATAEFVERQIGETLDSPDAGKLTRGDFKSLLQETLHDLGRPEPVYTVVDELGPDHHKTFVVQVVVMNHLVAQAAGQTKKEAQQEAARLALEIIRGQNPGTREDQEKA
jgi:ribonuclease III